MTERLGIDRWSEQVLADAGLPEVANPAFASGRLAGLREAADPARIGGALGKAAIVHSIEGVTFAELKHLGDAVISAILALAEGGEG